MKENSIKAGIDVRELRVGNRLYKDGIIVTIDARSIFDIWDKSTQYSPIPLTKKVLEKVKGCELISESPYRATWDIEYGGGRYITIVNHIPAKTWEVTFGSNIELQKPFLHILQNVVYFNWGYDLEITL